jgi:hypothetical protein
MDRASPRASLDDTTGVIGNAMPRDTDRASFTAVASRPGDLLVSTGTAGASSPATGMWTSSPALASKGQPMTQAASPCGRASSRHATVASPAHDVMAGCWRNRGIPCSAGCWWCWLPARACGLARPRE